MAKHNIKSKFEKFNYDTKSLADYFEACFEISLRYYNRFFEYSWDGRNISVEEGKKLVEPSTLLRFEQLYMNIIGLMQEFLHILRTEKFKPSFFESLFGDMSKIEANLNKLEKIDLKLDELDTEMCGKMLGPINNEILEKLLK